MFFRAKTVSKSLTGGSLGFRVSRNLQLSRSFSSLFDPFNPTEEHQMLRDTVRNFAVNEVDPQRLEFDREEKFNYPLFQKCGDLGLLGVTTDVEYGGSGMDATAACIVHEELSQADPGFCLAYLAHSMLLYLLI